MERPAFVEQRGDLVWMRVGRALATRIDDVSFTAEASWLTGRWTVVATSALLLPAPITIYVSRDGGAHGYWRNAPLGLRGMRDYFGYSDTPALAPLIVGDQTLAAILRHDKPRTADEVLLDEARDAVALHIRDGTIDTTTKVDADNARVLDDQLAIHQALAADHADLLDTWKATADELHGTVATSWPPTLTVPRAFGSTTIALRWPPSTHSSARASIELTADARGARLWSIEREPLPTPNTHPIGGQPFLVMGEPPISLQQLERAIHRADITSINVRRHVTITLARHAPDAAILDSVLELLGHLCGAPSEPYR